MTFWQIKKVTTDIGEEVLAKTPNLPKIEMRIWQSFSVKTSARLEVKKNRKFGDAFA